MNSNRNFFTQINQSISYFAEEVTICDGRIEENLFNVGYVPNEILIRFVDEIGSCFGLGIDLGRLQQFSFQAADHITYFEDKFMAVYSGGRKTYRDFDLDIKNPHDDYCVNYFCESKKTTVKFYDLDISYHEKPSLPLGSTFASPFGHGLGTHSNRKDVYFCHGSVSAVAEFYNMPQPTTSGLGSVDEDQSVTKVFGLSYDSKTLQPMKLKRYFYPRDPLLREALFDEVLHEY
ncbi:MAG: hypothetical protein B7Y39_18640 [Bdellovibrio sp. 28-41-41]|nr:MAG: hypothetical protein B7Y39_18640 [Bdellovibrio sp. 28-41-41]